MSESPQAGLPAEQPVAPPTGPPTGPPQPRPTRLANNRDFKHHRAASFLERRFSRYVKTKEDGGPLAASHAYARTSFGGLFPAQTVQEISGASYAGRTSRSHLPATMPFVVSFYAVALKGRFDPVWGFITDEGEKDGRGDAMDVARGIYELWYDAFMEDLASGATNGLRRLVQDAAVSTIVTGDADAVGNPLMDETRSRLLIVYQPTVIVTF